MSDLQLRKKSFIHGAPPIFKLLHNKMKVRKTQGREIQNSCSQEKGANIQIRLDRNCATAGARKREREPQPSSRNIYANKLD